MKKMTCIFCRNLVLTLGPAVASMVAAALFATLGINAVHGEAQSGGTSEVGKPAVSPLPPTTPPEIIKPVLPSDLKNADAVFNEIDVSGRGYVTRRETKDLIGFDEAFRAVDTKGSGKLTREQFRKAWALYRAVNK
ncbi:MAG TPA: hypothetical protein VLA64_09560 [Azonexus sp.]|nr:hypothetical protein [Azonexus sp.]